MSIEIRMLVFFAEQYWFAVIGGGFNISEIRLAETTIMAWAELAGGMFS